MGQFFVCEKGTFSQIWSHIYIYIYIYIYYIGVCVTEFWKITHMGVHEIIRIFMFSGLLL